ncbi:MAG: hypothetical protein RBQ72_00640 [Desulfobacterium sp.]|jgi:hypothetical protein|nr:hypothetical protein [Desulfobacterium sp.]
METNQQPDSTVKDQWLFIVVQNPGTGSEQFMGFKTRDDEQEFIPAFESRQEAEQCFLIMPKDVMKNKYEVQAIHRDDLILTARDNGFNLFLMDDKSRIKKKL